MRGHDPGQVRRHPRPADEGDVAGLPSAGDQVDHLRRVPVGRQDPDIGLQAETLERLGRRSHLVAVPRRTHQHANLHGTFLSAVAADSLAAIGVAAHEVGHAIQHAVNYRPLQIRASLVPAANIGANWGLPLAIIGFFINSGFMMNLGLVLFVGALLFHLVTLPVEFNASNRAIQLLDRGRYLSRQELGGTKKVLRAAAFTYVAATLVALANLFRILMLFGMRRDD